MKGTLVVGVLLGVLAFSLSALTVHAQFENQQVASGVINALEFEPTPIPATCTLALSYIRTDLNFDYVIGTTEAATLNAWFVIQSDAISFITGVPIPVIDPAVPVPFTIPAFPQLETIGVLTTINTAAEGIICRSFATVDTGPTTLSPKAATEELRKRFTESSRALPDG